MDRNHETDPAVDIRSKNIVTAANGDRQLAEELSAGIGGKRIQTNYAKLDCHDGFDKSKRFHHDDESQKLDDRSYLASPPIDPQRTFPKAGFELERNPHFLVASTTGKNFTKSSMDNKESRSTWEKYRPEGLKSEMWQYFQKYTNKRMPHVVVCDMCGKEVLVGLKGSTTNMKNHLKSHHPHLFANLRARQGFLEPVMLAAGQATFLDSFIRWQIQTLQPSIISDHPSFTAMISASHRAKWSLACSPAQNSRRQELRATVEGWLQKGLQNQPLALSLDSWKNFKNECYIELIAHFITKDWVLHSVTLDCSKKPTDGAALPLNQTIELILQKFSIRRENVSAAVNCSLFNAKEFELTFPSFESIDKSIERVAEKFLECHQFASTYSKCCQMSKCYSRSTRSSAELEDMCRHSGCTFFPIVDPICSSWYEKYQMLEQIHNMKVPLQNLGTVLDASDWSFIELIVRFTQPLSEARNILLNMSYVSISMVPQVIVALKTILGKLTHLVKENQDSDTHIQLSLEICDYALSELISAYGKDLDPIKGLPMEITLAQVLDPRTRFFLDNYAQAERQEIWNSVKEWAARIALNDVSREESMVSSMISKKEPVFQPYHHPNISPQLNQTGAESLQEKMTSLVTEKNLDSISFEGMWQSMQAKRTNELQPQGFTHPSEQLINILEVEIAKFVAIPCISKEDDPIMWWQQHNRMFPHLSELARSLLCIPAMPRKSDKMLGAQPCFDVGRKENLHGDDVSTIVFLHGSWDVAQKFSNISGNKSAV